MQQTLAVNLPDVAYARSGDVAIAYQLVGDAPMDIVFLRAITGDLVSTWEQPLLVRHVEGLASFGRVIMLDKRGTGLSDRVREVQSLETAMDDVRAVMDAVDSERAVLWTGGPATGISVLFAATYPERCAGLVLFDPRVRGVRSDDYPWAQTEDEWRKQLAEVRARWGSETTWRSWPINMRRRLLTTSRSSTGSSGTCAEASVRVPP
jgi:pimeloyl-ACP methyl ester carboxylesterase